MSLKSFIIASIAIHLIAGTALYFYYNPIVLDSKPILVDEEELKEPVTEENLDQEIPQEKFFSEKESLQKPTGADFKTKKPATAAKAPSLDKKEGLARDQTFSPPKESFVESEKRKGESARKRLEQVFTPKNKKGFIEEGERKELKLSQNPAEKPSLKKKRYRLKKQARDFSLLKQKPGNPPLSYPDFARKLKMEGTVILLFFVDERGLVEKMQLEKSSGHLELDNYVLRVLARYRFLENQEGWVRYKKTFILKGEEREYLRLRQEESNGFAEEKPLESFKEGFVEEEAEPEKKAFPNEAGEELAEKELYPSGLKIQQESPSRESGDFQKKQDNSNPIRIKPKPEEIEFIDYEILEESEPNPDSEEETLNE
ncbi:MAG: TonB family protein [Oligoflexia bacterium]|nr:TonB family protein [Oligoflexia bacterium]